MRRILGRFSDRYMNNVFQLCDKLLGIRKVNCAVVAFIHPLIYFYSRKHSCNPVVTRVNIEYVTNGQYDVALFVNR